MYQELESAGIKPAVTLGGEFESENKISFEVLVTEVLIVENTSVRPRAYSHREGKLQVFHIASLHVNFSSISYYRTTTPADGIF